MPDSTPITRRTFLVGGIAVGTIGLSLPRPAAIAATPLTPSIGKIHYIQLHCTKTFPLATALHTVESLTQDYTLEKVSAAGDTEFDEHPDHVLTTLYYKEGFRATLSSGPSPHPSHGTIRGEAGDIVVTNTHLDLRNKKGEHEATYPLTLKGSDSPPSTLAYILQALRQGVTVFPETSGV